MKMNSTFVGRFLLVLMLGSILLASCSPAPATPAPAPTVDQSAVIAAAVQTLSAQMTQKALAHPSATPTTPPTATPEPTETPVPFTPTPAFSPTPVTPTATQAPALSALIQYQTTYPENKREYIPNEHFNVAIGFKNTGQIAWDGGYFLKVVRADGEITVQPEAKLGKNIEPGQKAEFNFWAFGSETLGTHTWYFQLYTGSGAPVPGGYTAFTYTSK